MKKIILSLSFLFFAGFIFAGSPITSVNFYKSYKDIPVIDKAYTSGIINDTIADYLLNDTIAIEMKAAVINALSIQNTKKINAPLLMQYISKKYHLKNGFDINLLTADDVFCLGYLTITDNIEQTEKAIKILTVATEKNPKSYTMQIILALVETELYIPTNLCEVYKVCSLVNENKELTKDMKQSAEENIFSYINTYKTYCHDKK